MVKKYRDSFFFAAVCLGVFTLMILAACSRSSSASSTRPAASSGEAASIVPPRGGMPSLEHQNPVSTRNAPTQAAKPVLAAGLRAFSLGARTTPLMPEDFSLGKLQSLQPADPAEKAVLAVVQSFLAGLDKGAIDTSLYLPEARDALSFLLSPSATRGEDSAALAASAALPAPAAKVRIGAIVLEGDTAFLKLRLPGTKDGFRREGLLSLRERDGTWYIEAFALDRPESAELSFKPSSAFTP